MRAKKADCPGGRTGESTRSAAGRGARGDQEHKLGTAALHTAPAALRDGFSARKRVFM